ncbi:DUF1652 domain-containing protein [Pseudomonas sp. URMO17WK12:I11]|jgi:hypothetical protein|uniref:DUF1652 domain-containing protein n=1 Tax=Pseudomonas sp. URMO17WK12:I11 TaxID=1283291 RepID=UPI00071EF5BE|nr:DUF1652 domain-containing protein [Pseudomonas sp. URMO17WK12:I11]CRL47199.1 hypothetical protein PSHI_02200 [Pseudomonas sp. URMO17WK12:I11]
MIYLTQLRALLEQHFSPRACECSVSGDNSVTVKLYHPESGEVDLVVSGLKVSSLNSPQSLASLIEELRYELQSNSLHHPGENQ